MDKPIIGIAANQRQTELDCAPWSYTPSGFPNAVIAAGGIPFILPINHPDTAKAYIDRIDKLILTGGQNVLPKYYHEPKDPEAEDDYSEERDAFEMALVKEAIKQKKPIFAVCRGMQLMNVILGGSLYQNIPDHWQEKQPDTTSQTVHIEEGSVLSQFYQSGDPINSLHHQAIKTLAPGLKVVATSPEDGIIEAVESQSDDLRYLGVQWHPELLLTTDTPQSQRLFNYIVNHL